MSAAFEILMVALLAIGAFFVLVGSLGLVKLSDFFKRLHGPTKASTLGVGCVMIASIGHHATLGDGLGLRELLITGFLFITAPISAHLMAKAALSLAEDDPRPSPPPRPDQAQPREDDGPGR
ncbi:Na+/H+ antiporter subunit G [Luteimonas sp. RD2P54]|uniref:Na+/H+ antiporter subunit G n=1 Tax=Luteimonas endophytica TaxID=3042023 RepID=A0ABT6J884_9GAMM|nr:Na+/H+ antiporter subunit G [Luteimonas endophytica]MDH5823030.1 Na+/H+ antiporter subunit G [Luteimonas endophytica]